MSFSVPHRAEPYSSIPPILFGVLAFEVDQQAEAHRAHNANEPVKGIKPRREIGKGRADALPQAHQLLRQGSPRRQTVGRPQL